MQESITNRSLLLYMNNPDSGLKKVQQRLMNHQGLPDLMLAGDLEEDAGVELDSNYHPDQFKSDVEKIKEYIRAGDIFQAVLSQRFHTVTERSGFELYRVLRNVNPSPYMFFLKFNDVEVIGSSPERLLEVQEGKLEIHPIAGTRKRGATQEEDDALAEELLADEKNWRNIACWSISLATISDG